MLVRPNDTVGDLKKMLEDMDDDIPLQGELQGEPNYDWFIALMHPDDIEESHYNEQKLIVSMDM